MKLSSLIIIFLSLAIYSDITNTCEKELKDKLKSLPFNSILREGPRDFYMVSENLIQLWDTVNNTWKNHELAKSEYDSIGTIKKRIYISWDTSNVMDGFGFQYFIIIDENFKIIELITQDSTSESNQWINTEKFSLTYNDLDSVTKTVFQIWDTVANQWKNYCIESITYDSEGNKIEDLFQGWIGQDTLMFMLRTFYTYNQSGKIIESYSQEWQAYIDSIWYNKSKSIYKYDENDNLIERMGQEWRANAWINYFRNLYAVDSNNEVIEEVYQDWDFISNVWVNRAKQMYTYHMNGNILEQSWQNWNLSNDQWANDRKNTFSYNDNGDRVENFSQRWDKSLNQWVNNYVSNHTYDSNGNISESVKNPPA